MTGEHHTGTLERKVRAMYEGFRREFPPTCERVLFGGREMTLAEVVAALEAMEATFEAVHRAQRGYRQAVGARRRAMKGHRSTYEDAVCFLKHHLGKASPRLVGFGVALPKLRRPLTAEASAIARAKAEATRKARGVLGRRQRLALGRPPEPTLQVFGLDGQPLAMGSTPQEAASSSAVATVASAELPTAPN